MKLYGKTPKGRLGRIEYWNPTSKKSPQTGPVDPAAPQWSVPKHPAGAPTEAELRALKPHLGLIVDPIAQLARAEERYASPSPISLPADPLPVAGAPKPVDTPDAGPAPNLAGPSVMEPQAVKDPMAPPPMLDPLAPKPPGG